ncbi:MAG: hypothetical protein IJW92_05425 [Clostridia bacterium]|nr:hypothetical protein [Clostridia bacterium]
MKQIKIADTTLCREGSAFSFKEKIEIARQLDKLDADIIEMPSISNVRTDTLLIRTVSSFVKKSILSVAAGLTMESIEYAAAALENAAHPRVRIELPLSAVGMEYVCHKKPDKMADWVKQTVGAAKEKCADVEFCALDATRTDPAFLLQVINAAIEAGANEIAVCDSAAEMLPTDFADFVKMLAEQISVPLSVRCDDKNGMACASSVLAVKAGASCVKTAVRGDAVSLETFAGMVKNCGNRYDFSSGIRYTELYRIIKQIVWILDGAKKDKNTVAVIGVDAESIRLDGNDDQTAVSVAVAKLGYDLSAEDKSRVYEEFLRVAEKKTVGAKELDAIIASVALQVPATYRLVSYVINNGNIISSSAQITLEKNGSSFAGVCIGDGPVDAAFRALEQIIGHHYELDDFQIQSVTEGKEAMGSALVKLRSDGKLYSGNGISTDIIGAAIRAYINAVNKIVYEEATV